MPPKRFGKKFRKKLTADFKKIDEEMKREEKKPKLPQPEDGKQPKKMAKLSSKKTIDTTNSKVSNTGGVIDKIYNSYLRNLKRTERVNPTYSLNVIPKRGNFRYLLQQIAAYNGENGGKNDTLQTPFGKATVKYENGTDGMLDKHIIGPIPIVYTEICTSIDAVLKNDKFPKFYEIVLNYLKTLANDDYAGKKLSDIIINKDTFFTVAENFKCDDKSKIEKAENAATSLCAIFMVSESSRNRLFEGGKVARALFNSDTEDTVTEKIKKFPPSVKGGARCSRNVQKNGKSRSKKWDYFVDKLSDNSEDVSFDPEKEKENLINEIKRKINNDFLKDADIAVLTSINSTIDGIGKK